MNGSENLESSNRSRNATQSNCHSSGLALNSLEDVISESCKLVAPAWPLQSTVAVNPFWFLRDRHLTDVFQELAPNIQQHLFMPLGYYQSKLKSGEILTESLELAIKEAQQRWPDIPADLEFYKNKKDSHKSPERCTFTAAESLCNIFNIKQKIVEDLSKYCAAYFDESQALASYPWRQESFWQGWKEAQKYDQSMVSLGMKKFKEYLKPFNTLSPEQAIQYIFDRLEIKDRFCQYRYCQRLLSTMLGWASQFKYFEWQSGLGYATPAKSKIVELLAVQMIYDYLYYLHCHSETKSIAQRWASEIARKPQNKDTYFQGFSHLYVLQLATELTRQKRIKLSLNKLQKEQPTPPKYQMIFCIDVRSEMIRRHIENQSSDFQTLGFAGFFGVPLDLQKFDEKMPGHRLPVLLAPSIELKEVLCHSQDGEVNPNPLNAPFITSYFRNLRKASIGSLLYVELFGILALISMAIRGIKSLAARLRGLSSLSRFQSKSETNTRVLHRHPITTEQQVEQATGILQNLGLTSDFGRIIAFCGHGAQTTNNAQASALDCGACGGHAGDSNALYAVSLLNDADVRTGLSNKNIIIPSDTLFIAAVHETVTDTLLVLDEDKIPSSHTADIANMKAKLKTATQTASAERNKARSDVLDPKPQKRAENWSEVRPEWGLAGNSSFIVASRSRTRGVNLDSRAFLHEYDWKKDKEFKTLELIMTAPMVVTNWINMQYYGSVVAPDILGSGNKVIHNITGENGVVEGNGGDLRIGLSLQSVHDGNQFVHEPLRLSVLIEAPRNAIEDIIGKHKTVRDLIDNEWLHLLHIDSQTNLIHRRTGKGIYKIL